MKKWICLFCIAIASLHADLRPVPWLTDNAVKFLEDFLQRTPSAKVLEFGSGASTVWFAKRDVELVSVEHNEKWYEQVKEALDITDASDKVQYFFRPRPYYSICEEFPDEFFDLIVVDGRNRKGCIYHSLSKLKKGGVLMLDNAERPHYFAIFRCMSGWQRFDAPQRGPDQCGYSYGGWLTSWWIKPKH